MKANTYYVVRSANNPPPGYANSSWRKPEASNSFKTLEEAQATALHWAAKIPGSTYTVYKVELMGVARPLAPPSVWELPEGDDPNVR